MDIKRQSNSELALLRAEIEAEMNKRGLPFSVGEIGETLAVEYFNTTKGLPNLQAAPTGTKSIDALSRNGDRYSIKTRRKGKNKKTGTIYPDRANPDKQLFEYILLVEIDPNYELRSIHQLTWEQFENLRSWDKTMSAWYLSWSKRVLDQATLIAG